MDEAVRLYCDEYWKEYGRLRSKFLNTLSTDSKATYLSIVTDFYNGGVDILTISAVIGTTPQVVREIVMYNYCVNGMKLKYRPIPRLAEAGIVRLYEAGYSVNEISRVVRSTRCGIRLIDQWANRNGRIINIVGVLIKYGHDVAYKGCRVAKYLDNYLNSDRIIGDGIYLVPKTIKQRNTILATATETYLRSVCKEKRSTGHSLMCRDDYRSYFMRGVCKMLSEGYNLKAVRRHMYIRYNYYLYIDGIDEKYSQKQELFNKRPCGGAIPLDDNANLLRLSFCGIGKKNIVKKFFLPKLNSCYLYFADKEELIDKVSKLVSQLSEVVEIKGKVKRMITVWLASNGLSQNDIKEIYLKSRKH